MNINEEKELKIDIPIRGLRIPMIINRNEEEIFRKAGKYVENYLEKFQSEYPDKDSEEILSLVALKLSVEIHKMELNEKTEL